jgi:phage-related holin
MVLLCILMLDVSALYVLLDDIVFMVVAVLCIWLSYVYCHLTCTCGLVMCSCCIDYIGVLLKCRAAG